MHALSEALPKACRSEEGGCHLGHFCTEYTWRGPYHLHHDELPSLISTHVLHFIWHIPPSSELLNETLLYVSFIHSPRSYSSLFLLFCIPHSLSLFISLLQALCAISDALCSIRDAAEEAERVNRHEGIEPTAPWRRDGGRDHQQNIEKTTLTKGIRQQMDLTAEGVESFRSETAVQHINIAADRRMARMCLCVCTLHLTQCSSARENNCK